MAPRRENMQQQQHSQLVSARQKKSTVFHDHDANVEEWVYRFLGNLAAIEEKTNQARRSEKALLFDKSNRKRSNRRFRAPTPYARKRVVTGSRRNLGDSENKVDVLLSPRNDKTVDADSETDSPSTDRDRTLLQRINRYIRAGIAEGKRRAKRYVQKALTFALEMGYLVPADDEGKLLRVSLQSLVKSVSEKISKKQKNNPGKVEKHQIKRSKKKSPGGKAKLIEDEYDTESEERPLKKQSRRASRLIEDSIEIIEEDDNVPEKTSSGEEFQNNPRSTDRSPSRSGRLETRSASKVERRQESSNLVAVCPRAMSAPNVQGPE